MHEHDTPNPAVPGGNGAALASAGESAEGLKRRVAELEAALERVTRQREEARRMLWELHAVAFPDDPPPTEEELCEERKTLNDKSISEMIAELERGEGAATT